MNFKQRLIIKYIRTKFKVLTAVSKRKAAEEAFKLFSTPIFKTGIQTPTVFGFAERLEIRLNNLLLQGYRWNKDKPNTILILHGFGSAAHNFKSYVTAMLEKGYQVLAFDAPAHGRSGGKTVTAIDYALMIDEILKLYGPVHGFISHSLGGLALSLSLEKLPHTEQLKAVLIAPATETTSAIDGAFRMLQINDKAVRREFDSIIYEKSGHGTTWFSVKRAMKNINAAILWIHDEQDTTTPFSDALKVKELGYPNITFMITKGLGHRKIYRDAAVKNAVAAFL